MPQLRLVVPDVATALRNRARAREPLQMRLLDANVCALATGATTEFARVPGLRVETWRT